MKLIKLEAHGFKSFADPVVLRFDGGIVGIVGPNGSGKSNINDAIRWVLGEQSSKELRGDSMADVIFAGSKTAQPMNKAQVTLTFDNKERLSSIDADTISISRVIERDKGINEYYINGEKARLKEIKMLAMETGIGKSSLAIISQGTVSDIAQSSDEQRRKIFEEAAGVSKYKFRKEESLKKLDQAQQSLKIIQAKLSEMQKRLEGLKIQAEKAYKYKELSKVLQEIEVPYLAFNIDKNQNLVDTLSQELEGFEETESSYKQDIKDLETQNTSKSELLKDLKTKIAQYSNIKETLKVRIDGLESSIQEAKTKRKLLAQGTLATDAKEQKAAIISEVQELENNLNSFKQTYDEIFKTKLDLDTKISKLTQEINELTLKYKAKESRNAELKAQLNHLKTILKSRNNLFQGTKTILENKSFFKGLKGIVGDLIKSPSEYTVALETILKPSLQHLVVDNNDTAIKAIDFLKKNNGGRATFIPLATIDAKHVRDDYLFALKNQKGYIDLASNLTIVDQQYQKLNNFLLGNVIVAKDIESATFISKITEKKYPVVSLQGDLVRVGGILVGGSKEQSDHTFGLEDKIKTLQDEHDGNQLINQKLAFDLQTLNDNLRSMQNNMQFNITQLNSLQYQIKEKQNQIDKLKSKLSITDLELKDNSFEALNQAQTNILKLQQEISQNEYNLQIALQEKDSISTDIESNNQKIKELHSLLEKLWDSFKKKNNNLTNAKNQLAIDLQRLNEHYNMTLDYAKNNFDLSLAANAAKESIDSLRSDIKALGNVNLDSIAEYEELNERFTKDSATEQEIIEARNLCLAAITELDKKIILRLSSIVNDVNDEMHKVFSSLFGGGTAKVQFLDPNNVLESGISIYAQPPGKKVKNLKLFSGGEKALIAISLLFAILRARPLPLCILDEVEAALDESNVVRYAQYLQELKHKTQFLVITHRTGTMTRVDALFGATMQRRGVTNFFSVELAQAKKLIDQE